MTFEAYLVNSGLINEEDLHEAMDRLRKARIPIGKLALMEGKLTMKQIFQILGEQASYRAYSATKGYKRFGEIAVELGLLAEEDIESLLKKQEKGQKSIGDILIEMGAIEKEELEMEYADYNDEYGEME
ncbi:MAG: hypothetical protein ACE5FU_11045 [Nitrospinota bacterium]